jgi:hypothetical protein
MSALDQIAWFQNRRDEIPNQLLAKQLAESSDQEGIAEIARNLTNSEANIQSDCLKVLYETGYLNPQLIAPYADDFLKLLTHRSNRMVWGGMIALATIAHLQSEVLIAHEADIRHSMENGSVITVDNATKILSTLAKASSSYRKKIFPYLLQHLDTCRPVDFPRYAESILLAVDEDNKAEFRAVLEKHLPLLSGARAVRTRKVLKGLHNAPAGV